MNSFLLGIPFYKVGKTQDLPSKIWQTLGDALTEVSKPHIVWGGERSNNLLTTTGHY
jgi:hypothetical protein